MSTRMQCSRYSRIAGHGWVTFSLIKESSQPDIKVPFLVAKDSLDMPIVGFNVIEEITTNSEGCVSTSSEESMVDVLASSMKGVERGKVEALVQFIKTETTKELSPGSCLQSN